MTISNTDQVIDSRDIIARIEELTEELECCPHCGEVIEVDATACPDCNRTIDLTEEHEELKALEAVAEEGEQYASDWLHGATMIHKDYFTEYCEELCEDIGAIPSDAPSFIIDNIDWEGVAEDLKADYTEIDFAGTTYYIR